MNEKKLNNVLSLEPKERYGYLIQKVADFEEIFVITDTVDAFVTVGDSDMKCIPVWPEHDFAKEFLTDDWADFKIKTLSLNEFYDWLDKLEMENYHIAGFPNKDLNSIVVKPQEIKSHLIYECDQYE